MTPDINILPADTFIVTSKSIFNSHNQKIVMMLYQPIIGSLATSLYFTLINYLDRKETNHYHLMMSMKLNIDTIIESRKKLEGIGLIKTYISQDDNIKKFVYEIYSPLSVSEFISSPLLNTLLLNNVGEKDYKDILSNFKTKTIDLSKYQDISSSFHKVFKLENVEINNNLELNIEKNIKNEVNVKANIDLKNILTLIPDDLLNKKSITKSILTLINNIAYVYNLDDDAVKEIIINSIDVSHKIDKDLFKHNAENYYNFNNSGKITNIVYKKQPDDLKNKVSDTSNKSKLIYSLENVSPYEFLSSKYQTGKPTKSDLKIVEYLLADLKMQPGVVNVLLDYILRTHDNKLSKAYVDAVASQWLKSHIETTKDALEIAKKEYKNIKNIKSNNKYKKSEAPKWVNQKITSEVATIEEQEEMSKMIKELVGEK